MSDLSSFLSTRNKQWSAKLWDGFIEAVQARLAPLDEQLDIQKEVTDAIIARGLTVIEQELAPIVAQADQILGESTASITAKLDRFEQKVAGGTVICSSKTSATLANAATLNLTLIEADREFFAPTPFLALSRASTTANWAIGKVNSFNRSTGALSITLEQVTGPGGPYTDWIITSLPGATLLQKSYYEQTLALRQQVAEDKAATTEDRQTAVEAKDAAQTAAGQSVAAKNASQQAYADVRQVIAEPIVPPVNPVVGQIWWDGAVTRVYDGVGFAPTVTTSIGGRRFEQGTFGPAPDGVISVGGGFTAALVFVNGSLLREGEDYTANSPDIVILAPHEGDEYFVEAYLATDATDYDTKKRVNQKIETALTEKAVRVDAEQAHTAAERDQARANIDAQQAGKNLEAFRQLVLAANKILRTDANGDLTLSDITAAASVLLKIAGTAASNKLPYFTGSNTAALADFTAAARALCNLSGTAAADMLPYLTGGERGWIDRADGVCAHRSGRSKRRSYVGNHGRCHNRQCEQRLCETSR